MGLKYIKEISSRDVYHSTDYNIMSNSDRALFFKAYKYVRKGEKYILTNPEYLDQMYDNSQVLIGNE